MTGRLRRIERLLRRLAAVDLGYPPGENVVRPARPPAVVDAGLAAAAAAAVPSVRAFYTACDGLCLPDIHNGYFADPVGRLAGRHPYAVVLGRPVPVLAIGSTGGGDLLAVARADGRVLFLPSDWATGEVYEAPAGQVRVVAADMGGLLDRVADDLAAVVRGDDRHPYLDRRGE